MPVQGDSTRLETTCKLNRETVALPLVVVRVGLLHSILGFRVLHTH